MANTNELAKEYASYLRLNRNNLQAVLELARRINGLVYTASNSPISRDDKKEILDIITRELSHKKEMPGGGFLIEAEDSSELIKLIQMLRESTLK